MKRPAKGVKTQRHLAFYREVARIAKKRQFTEQVVTDQTKYTRKVKHVKGENE